MRKARKFFLRGLAAGFSLMLASHTTAQTFTTLYSFTDGSDGGNLQTGLLLSGDTLYGTATGGGSGKGTVFAVNTDGTGFTTLYSFTNGSDGRNPEAGLVLSGNTLYGTARDGGGASDGTVFAVNTDGTGFRTLHSFPARSGLTLTNSDGAYPGPGGLILFGDTLYGTAVDGGGSDGGTVFAVNTDGTAFTTLYSFTGGSDGGNPQAELVLSGNTLYGTAESGGRSGDGTVFAVNADGSDFTTLHSFTGGSDGGNPQAELVLSDDTLYGTASVGGIGYGTVFSLSLPPVSAPQLSITLSGTNVVLTWSANAIGFNLQSTTNLGSSAVWSTNSPAPALANGQNTVSNAISKHTAVLPVKPIIESSNLQDS